MKKFIIRYGVFMVFAAMLAGIIWVAKSYVIHVKQPVTLFITDSSCKAYLAPTDNFHPKKGDILTIHQTPYGDFSLVVDSIYVEPASIVLFFQDSDRHMLASSMSGNTIASGYLFTGKEKMGKLIWRKLRVR